MKINALVLFASLLVAAGCGQSPTVMVCDVTPRAVPYHGPYPKPTVRYRDHEGRVMNSWSEDVAASQAMIIERNLGDLLDPPTDAEWKDFLDHDTPLPARSLVNKSDPSTWPIVPQRKPVGAQRPHKVTLVAVEDYTFASREFPKQRHGKRAIFDIDPPLGTEENWWIDVDVRLCDHHSSSWWQTPFDEHGKRYVDTEDDGFTPKQPRGPVYGVEVFIVRAPGHKGEEPPVPTPVIRLDGKTVYGKEK
jgi:hypothetical protein